MSSRRILVYGASGHGKVVADIVLARGDAELIGFVDDNGELRGAKILGLPVLGCQDWLQEESKKSKVVIALGIGDNATRQRLAQKLLSWGLELATIVHPSASVSTSSSLGIGTVVMSQAAINPCAQVGRGVIVNTGAVVEHDVKVGDFGHVGPNAAMAGASTLGDLSFLGTGAIVNQNISIGRNTIVGIGAAVVSDIPDSVVAFGVPARIHRKL